MKTIVNIAKKAFREGSNIYGEKITGYVSSKLEQSTYQKNHYSITLRLMTPEGRRCNTMVGFELISQGRESNKSFCGAYECEPSPYGYYFNVISGHVVFTIPITTDMLDLFPMGLNKKSLDTYSIEELESRVLELKKKEFNSAIYKANREILMLRESLGLSNVLVSVSDINYRVKTEEDIANEIKQELPF
jgi:hypothetical protein